MHEVVLPIAAVGALGVVIAVLSARSDSMRGDSASEMVVNPADWTRLLRLLAEKREADRLGPDFDFAVPLRFDWPARRRRRWIYNGRFGR